MSIEFFAFLISGHRREIYLDPLTEYLTREAFKLVKGLFEGKNIIQ